MLARNIAIRNKALTVEQINECVQRILDRLIFVRNLEDRQIEEEDVLLKASMVGSNVYKRLLPFFGKLNSDYIGLLFKKHISEDIDVDDEVIKDIIRDMCYPNSPYQFDIIEVEILGLIYEKFLGSKIRLTDDHHAKVEEKPEVNHAGGVYYTPQFIVDYIVQNTVGERIMGNNPEEIEKIKILDPACGSGSFLIGAFNYLMNYHEIWYQKNTSKRKYKQDYYFNHDGQLKLTLKKKAEILKNNLFGVDIDREATEVAIMSLYLKLMEEGFDKGQAMMFLKGHILPDITSNIKCGNSLISRDQIFEQKMFDNYDINAFDWKDDKNGFGEVFSKQDGFDCVIGNPPYIKTQELQSFQPIETEIYKNIYKAASKGNFDIYIIFIEKALSLLNKSGLLGYICPHKFFNSNYGAKIREIIAEQKNVSRIIHFGVNQIFENSTTYTCLLFLSSLKRNSFDYYEFKDEVESVEELLPGIKMINVPSERLIKDNWNFMGITQEGYLARIKGNNRTLGEIASNIFQGPKAGADPVFIMKMIEHGNNKSRCYSTSLQKEVFIETSILKPYVKGKNIKRYAIHRGDEYIIFPYNANGELISESHLKQQYPLVYQYLSAKPNYDILLKREDGRFRKIWWSYSRPQNMHILDKKKLLTPFNAFNSSFSYDDLGDFIFSAGVSGAYGILIKREINMSYEYLLGLLNSSLLDKYLKTISTALRGGFYSYENKYIKDLPIYVPDSKDKEKYIITQRIEGLVKQVITVKRNEKRKADAEYLENRIDEMVCKLYGVTER